MYGVRSSSGEEVGGGEEKSESKNRSVSYMSTELKERGKPANSLSMLSFIPVLAENSCILHLAKEPEALTSYQHGTLLVRIAH